MDPSEPTTTQERTVAALGWWRVAVETFSMGAWHHTGNGFADGALAEDEARAHVANTWGGRAGAAERV